VFVVHVAEDPGKEDSIHEHVLLRDPNRFFRYAGGQSLKHALLVDVQGTPGDSGELVLVNATPGVLALGVQYHEDRRPDERPPSIDVFRPCLALLGLEFVGVAHLDDSTETRDDVGAHASNERATALVLVMDGGRRRLGSECTTRWEQDRFSCPDPELIEAGAGALGMLHAFTRIGHGVSAVRVGLTRYLNLPSECKVCQRRLRSSEESRREGIDRKTVLYHESLPLPEEATHSTLHELYMNFTSLFTCSTCTLHADVT
jgi:hypothetical protein